MNERKSPPNRRTSVTHQRRTVNGNIFVTIGKYPNGCVADLFIDIQKDGSLLRSLMSAFGIVTSVAIQHGVTVETIAKALRGFGKDELPSVVVDVMQEENAA